MNRFPVVAALAALSVSLIASSSAAEPRSPEVEAARAEIVSAFGFVPTIFETMPDDALPGAWGALRDLELNPSTAIPGKYKSLIAMAVAAQIPCSYCLYIDSAAARQAGASELEIREALGMAALTRHWSTVLNGRQIKTEEFRADIEGILAFVSGAADRPAPPAIDVTDAGSAYQDMKATLGRVPGFMRAYPEIAIAGAWKEFKSLGLSPSTEIPGKYKELIGLAVASQIPCMYCIEAHTAFASHMGATPEEVSEAVGMAALVRHWSTVANGSQQELDAFKAEADRMLKNAGDSARVSGD